MFPNPMGVELYKILNKAVETSQEPQKELWQTLGMLRSLKMIPEAWLPIMLRVEKEEPLDKIGCLRLLQEMLQAEAVFLSEKIRQLQNEIITDNPTPPPYPEQAPTRNVTPSDRYKS